MSLSWQNLRLVKDSLQSSFEEFVCQLARKEAVADGTRFVRKGAPDAGVECFWILNSGSEWAWQAKFFTQSLGASQWKQLDDSVKTALDAHKKLTRFFVAIPMNPPDARVGKQKSMLQKWEEHVVGWEKLAKQKRMSVEFIAWWESDLFERLQRPSNEGLLYFWFKKDELTDEWFRQHRESAIENLGHRYTPELNFELSIAKIFDGLAQDEKFKRQVTDLFDDFFAKMSEVRLPDNDELSDSKSRIGAAVQNLKKLFVEIPFASAGDLSFFALTEELRRLREQLIGADSSLRRLRDAVQREKSSEERYDWHLRNVYEAQLATGEAISFLTDTVVSLSLNPYLLLKGGAGMGKSHLFADLVRKRGDEGKASIFILGQHLRGDEDPWTQILRGIGFSGSKTEFLGALNSKAQAIGSRVIVFIDAANEGNGKVIWPHHLPGFAMDFAPYKWVGLAMSVRTSYADLIAPANASGKIAFVRFTHEGFYQQEYQASKLFFDTYGIESPGIPVLHPEFRNPLFLKIFCEGLKKAGVRTIPTGHTGISTILSFYVESINKSLAQPSRFNFPNDVNVISQILLEFVRKKLEPARQSLSIGQTVAIVNEVQRQHNIQNGKDGTFFDALVSEGLFSKNLLWKEGGSEEVIYVAYERFDDYLTAIYLIEGLTAGTVAAAFQKGGSIFDYVKDDQSISVHRGLLEMLSVLLPEKFDIELYEAAPAIKENRDVAEAFVSSMVWRKHETLKEKVITYINSVVLRQYQAGEQFWEAVVTAANIPGHLFNADKTHIHLSKKSLADRDAQWTQMVHEWGSVEHGAKRLIDWAWTKRQNDGTTDECIRLSAVMLAWFLGSTNRTLRDCATKALINLLQQKPLIAKGLLEKFSGVNDPYIKERLFAVAYGCAIRCSNLDELKLLAEYIYSSLFDQPRVYPHVLLRDYARSAIEYALSVGVSLNIDVSKVRPPYKSDFPAVIPTDEEIAAYDIDYQSKGFQDYMWSQHLILSSMRVEHSRSKGMYGDFGRYTFQSAFRHWDDQLKAKNGIVPDDLKNIAIRRIFELGYDVEKHGKFDRQNQSSSRSASRTERIGKKYQWIAFHELLAKVSDKYQMTAPWSEFGKPELAWFEGPWEPFLRDIDPTILQPYEPTRSESSLYFGSMFGSWGGTPKQWLSGMKDFPDASKLFQTKLNEKDWLILEGHYEWKQGKPFGVKRFSEEERQVWCSVRSYLVKEQDYEKVVAWLSKQNFMNRWMPESHDNYQLFNREYYWSPGHAYMRRPYFGTPNVELTDKTGRKKIANGLVTAESYFWESEKDHSKSETPRFLKPCQKIFDGLHLQYGEKESELYSPDGELICFDFAESFKTQPKLAIRKDALEKFLCVSGLKIVWTILGEKVILGDTAGPSYGPWPSVSGVGFLKNGKMKTVLRTSKS